MGKSGGWMPMLLVLGLSVAGTQALCTDQELTLLFSCIEPYNAKFFQAVGTGSYCDKSRISTAICTDYATIAICVNKISVSRTNCRPFAVGQINPRLVIPCKINDFEEVCKNAPALDKGSSPSSSSPSTSTAVPTVADAAGAGKTATAPISLILMSSFITVLLATLM